MDPTLVLLTPAEAARRLSISVRTLERQIAAGHFPQPRRIGRSVRILASDLQAYAQGLPTQDIDWRGLPGDLPPPDACPP
jgi:excisionase family DNA binding protein